MECSQKDPTSRNPGRSRASWPRAGTAAHSPREWELSPKDNPRYGVGVSIRVDHDSVAGSRGARELSRPQNFFPAQNRRQRLLSPGLGAGGASCLPRAGLIDPFAGRVGAAGRCAAQSGGRPGLPARRQIQDKPPTPRDASFQERTPTFKQCNRVLGATQYIFGRRGGFSVVGTVPCRTTGQEPTALR